MDLREVVVEPVAAADERLLALNRGHWTVEATHHILDCCWDEDRCRIRTGHPARRHSPERAVRNPTLTALSAKKRFRRND